MVNIFKCKTNEAYCLKILAELLMNNIKTACFEIDGTGIFMCMMDHHRKILVDLKLYAENFSLYKINTEKIYVGLNLNHFHKMLKSIKKKDSIELYISSDNPNELGIKVIPKENNRITTSYIKIQNIQNIIIDLPTGYGKPIIILSSDYQKMCKDLGSIGNTILVSSRNLYIKFDCDTGGILKRNVKFGEIDDSDDDDENIEKKEYNEEFASEQLCRVSKVSGLGTNIQIFPGNPFLLRSNVGNLGKISIYIKSKNQIENEFCKIDSDSDSD